MATPQEAQRWVEKLSKELRDRQPDISLYDEYYRGVHRLRFASDQFASFFSGRYREFSDNWTQVVADAPTERLEVVGVRPSGGEIRGDADLWETWIDNEADALSDLAWLDAIIAKRSFALVWGDPPMITWEHPSQAIVDYDPETRQRRAGLKFWDDGEYEFATLYLPDQVYKFQRRRMTEERSTLTNGVRMMRNVGLWDPRQPGTDDTWPIPNPMGVVPLVEAQNRPRLLGEPMSDVAGTVAMQDAINLLWGYLFNAADFASFPQRVVMGAERPKVPILDDNGQVVGERDLDLKKFAVNRVAWLEDPNASISEWSAANLEAYTKIIEVQVGHVAAQTRTPAHYLLVGSAVSNVSGDTMKALETGLVMRTKEKTANFGRAARDIFSLVALAKNDPAKAAAVRQGEVLWRDVESRSEAQLVDGLQKLQAMGFPFEWLGERYGLGPAELSRVMEMVRQESERDPAGRIAQALVDSNLDDVA